MLYYFFQNALPFSSFQRTSGAWWHDASNSEATATLHDFDKKDYCTSERFTRATYDSYFWNGSQGVGITFAIQFFQVQLDWSRQNISLPIERLPRIRFRQPAVWLSLALWTSAWLALQYYFSFYVFKLTFFSMLNEDYFVQKIYVSYIWTLLLESTWITWLQGKHTAK